MDVVIIQNREAKLGRLNLDRFAKALKDHRGYKPLGIFVSENKIPVTEQTINNIERGKRNPSPAVLLRLLEIMDLPVTDFIELAE